MDYPNVTSIIQVGACIRVCVRVCGSCAHLVCVRVRVRPLCPCCLAFAGRGGRCALTCFLMLIVGWVRCDVVHSRAPHSVLVGTHRSV